VSRRITVYYSFWEEGVTWLGDRAVSQVTFKKRSRLIGSLHVCIAKRHL
jgi:hypothetical protein